MAALMAALTAVGAYLNLTLLWVPLTFQTMFVILAGFILGPAWGAGSIGLYVVAGLAGLPVFSRGGSGLGYFLGPTGGYIVGFVMAATLAGLARVKEDRKFSMPRTLVVGAAALLSVYATGVPWLKFTLKFTWTKALAVGFVPFVPGDAIKLLIAAWAYKYLHARRLTPR